MLPFQWGLLIFRGTLTAPGICGWCLTDPELPAWERLKSYLILMNFMEHIENHLIKGPEKKVVRCPEWREQCASSSFMSVQDLRYRLQDTHCIPLPTKRTRANAQKRRLPADKNFQENGLRFLCFNAQIFQQWPHSRRESHGVDFMFGGPEMKVYGALILLSRSPHSYSK